MTGDSGSLRFLAMKAGNLVRELPASLLDSLVRSLEQAAGSESSTARTGIVEGFSNPHYRSLVANFFNAWRARAPDISREAVALALLTAGLGERGYREGQSIEVVWTGPEVGDIPLRRTEQAMLQVIDSATRRMTIVSYAVYNIPHIREGLVTAARRGVSIDLVVETPDKLETENTY